MNGKQQPLMEWLGCAIIWAIPLMSTASCPAGFVPHPINGLCYGHMTTKLHWRTAGRDCMSRRQGGMLVKVTDTALNDWIRDNVLPSNAASINLEYWVGINDIEHGGEYKYSDGTPLTFDNWDMTGHGDADEEGCIRGKAHYSFMFSDTRCRWDMEYICQAPYEEAEFQSQAMSFVSVVDASSVHWKVISTQAVSLLTSCSMLCVQTSTCSAVLTEPMDGQLSCTVLQQDRETTVSVPAGATLYEWIPN